MSDYLALPEATRAAFDDEVERITGEVRASLDDLSATLRAQAEEFADTAKDLARDFAKGDLSHSQAEDALKSLRLALQATLAAHGYSVKAETVRMAGEALRGLMAVALTAL